MLILIVSLVIIVALLLILVVLAQNSKGGGLSSQFTNAGASQLIGVKRSGDILERITWGLAIVLLALCLGASIMIDSNNQQNNTFSTPNLDAAEQQQPLLPGTDLDIEDEFQSSDEETGESNEFIDEADDELIEELQQEETTTEEGGN